MIRQAAAGDLETLADLALLLWPGHAREALSEELSALLTREDAAFFLLSEHTSPVGYLEGIFVKASCRGRGYAAELLRACEAWAREKGCAEFASDCPAENEESRAFHVKSGFSEANRIICFTKKL